MKVPLPPTLSEYLLRESERFDWYPDWLIRRRKDRLTLLNRIDEKVSLFVEWRKTFAPRPKQASGDLLDDLTRLDQFYCREVLRAVPSMVERTRKLAPLVVSEIKDSQS